MRRLLATATLGILLWTAAGGAMATEGGPVEVLSKSGSTAPADEKGIGQRGLSQFEASTSVNAEPGLILFGSSSGVHTMKPDGSSWELVTNDTIGSWTWSTFGTHIAFEENLHVKVMRADGTDRSILASGFSVNGISWSPDGWTLAFSGRKVIDPANTQDLYLVNRDGSGLRKLLDLEYDVNHPTWSPDGTKIAFSYPGAGDWQDIFVVNADGSGRVNLTKSAAHDDRLPDWSPNTNGIVFESTDRSGLPDPDIYVVSPAGGPVTRLTDSPVEEGAPVWSPDGDQIAFHGYDGSEFNIYTMTATGSNITNLTPGEDGLSFPKWAPKRSGKIRGGIFDQNAQPVSQGHVDIWSVEGSWVDSYQAMSTDAFFATDNLPDGNYLALAWNGDSQSFINYFPKWWVNAPLLRPDRATVIEVAGGNYDGVEVLLDPLFVDMFESTFTGDIAWMQFAGVTKGCNPPDNDRYCPNEFVTRGQMAAFLVRALGYTDDGGGDLFIDDDGSVFENDIDKLGTAGVTKGCNPPTNERYCPNDFVTRGQMAAFLVRALAYVDDGGGDLFVDDDTSVFENDIDRLGTAGVTKGCNPPVNDRFCPGDFVTRGQMAAFLHRALGS